MAMLRIRSEISVSAFSQVMDMFAAFRPAWRLARMLDHFGVERDQAAPTQMMALQYAGQVCERCAQAARCRSWLSWGAANDAPRLFCPLAELLDRLAAVIPGPSQSSDRLNMSRPITSSAKKKMRLNLSSEMWWR